MKPAKKQKTILPEVIIHGDLQDLNNLVKALNKKKVIVIFRDEEQGTMHLRIERKIQQILQEDIKSLEKDYKLIYFSFYPSRKKAEPVVEVKPEEGLPINEEKPEKVAKKGKKEKKEKNPQEKHKQKATKKPKKK
jgi:hypothetical protein